MGTMKLILLMSALANALGNEENANPTQESGHPAGVFMQIVAANAFQHLRENYADMENITLIVLRPSQAEYDNQNKTNFDLFFYEETQHQVCVAIVTSAIVEGEMLRNTKVDNEIACNPELMLARIAMFNKEKRPNLNVRRGLLKAVHVLLAMIDKRNANSDANINYFLN